MKGPLDYLARWPLRLWLAMVGAFLYLPLLALVVFSFNDSRRITVWRGFSLRWYAELFDDGELVAAFGNSLVIAAASTIISLIHTSASRISCKKFVAAIQYLLHATQ